MVRLPSICVLSHREGLRTELRPRVCSQPLETARRVSLDERGLKSQLHANRGRATSANAEQRKPPHKRSAANERSTQAQQRPARRKNARDAVNVGEPRKVSTGFKTASTPDFKTAKAAMTDAPGHCAARGPRRLHADPRRRRRGLRGPTQLNEEEEEEETPAVPRQTPSGTAGPPPPRPRFSYTSQSSTPPPATTPADAAAPDALRDVLATAPVQRQLSDASRHATAGDTAPPEPIDLTQDEDTEVERASRGRRRRRPRRRPTSRRRRRSTPRRRRAATRSRTTPSRTTTTTKMARSRRRRSRRRPRRPMEDDPIEDADAVDAILDAGRLRTQDPPPAEEEEPASDASQRRRPATQPGAGRGAARHGGGVARGAAGRRDRALRRLAAAAATGLPAPAAREDGVAGDGDDGRSTPAAAAAAGSAAAPMDVDEAAEAPAPGVPSPAGATVLYDDSQTQPPSGANYNKPAGPRRQKRRANRPRPRPCSTTTRRSPSRRRKSHKGGAGVAAVRREPSQVAESQPCSQLAFASQPSQPSQGTTKRRSASDQYRAIAH